VSKGVYLGDNGSVEIGRESLNAPWAGTLDAADVNVLRRRFSVAGAAGMLISGDRIAIVHQGAGNLELVANWDFPDWSGYVFVDDAGGMRLYDDFDRSINGEESEALELVAPTSTQEITIETTNTQQFRFVSQVRRYEFTTNRNTIDLSAIGDEFQKMYATGLISGQGTIDCFWEYTRPLCKYDCGGQIELPQYFADLVLRLQQGSSFAGRFNLFTDPVRSVWWECPICIVTGVAMNFEPTQAIQTRIEFVTSGPIRMHIGRPEGYLLIEQSGLLLQEDDHAIELQDD
jgi:hypothetical protein